jgi:transposase
VVPSRIVPEFGIPKLHQSIRSSSEIKGRIRIVLDGLRGEESIAEPCRREGIVQNLYYRWSKDFLESG